MKSTISFDPTNFALILASLKEEWNKVDQKVFVLKPNAKIENPKTYYEKNFVHIGTPFALGEDVNKGGRGEQRTGEIWFQVRYDSKHPDAYRHSSHAQPLHTDGSYIPNYPSSTILICEAAAAEGGETTFIDNKIVAEILKKTSASLFKFITEHKVYHERSGDETYSLIINPEEEFRINYNYYCLSRTKNSRDTLDRIEEFQDFLLNNNIIRSSTIPVKLEPGDAVFWKDDKCLHGRNSFNPKEESERFIWKCAIDITL